VGWLKKFEAKFKTLTLVSAICWVNLLSWKIWSQRRVINLLKRLLFIRTIVFVLLIQQYFKTLLFWCRMIVDLTTKLLICLCNNCFQLFQQQSCVLKLFNITNGLINSHDSFFTKQNCLNWCLKAHGMFCSFKNK
jgi:hypothetical protein